MDLYIARDGVTLGPYRESDLLEQVRDGIFTREDLGCPAGEQQWRPLSELLALPPAPPAYVPPPAPPPAPARERTTVLPTPQPRAVPQQSHAAYDRAFENAAQSNNGEKAFYQKEGVTVTRTRFVVAEQTYAMRNITSVRFAEKPGSYLVAVILIVFGALFLLAGVGASRDGTPAVVIGLLMLVPGVLVALAQSTTYLVVLTTNGGEVRAVTSTDKMKINAIVQALNVAIATPA